MSLDLYIESKTPVLHRGTGVYIRENGETKELETRQEVLKHFPDANPDNIRETSYEDNDFFHINITHNLTDMADECSTEYKGKKTTLYNLLWHPEKLSIKTPDIEYIVTLQRCHIDLLKHPAHYEKFNPSNGWGSYDGLVNKLKQYIKALLDISTDFDNYTIVSDT